MPAGRHPYFSRAGWIPFAVCAAGGIMVARTLGWAWSVPFWLGCAVIVYLFRDPRRDIPSSPLAVVSPADGVVDSIEEVSDPYLDRQALLLVINMNHTGVYSTRSPVEGKVLEPRNSADGANRPHGVWLQTDEGDDLVFRLDGEPVYRLEGEGANLPEPMFAILNFAKINAAPMEGEWVMEVDWVKHESLK